LIYKDKLFNLETWDISIIKHGAGYSSWEIEFTCRVAEEIAKYFFISFSSYGREEFEIKMDNGRCIKGSGLLSFSSVIKEFDWVIIEGKIKGQSDLTMSFAEGVEPITLCSVERVFEPIDIATTQAKERASELLEHFLTDKQRQEFKKNKYFTHIDTEGRLWKFISTFHYPVMVKVNSEWIKLCFDTVNKAIPVEDLLLQSYLQVTGGDGDKLLERINAQR